MVAAAASMALPPCLSSAKPASTAPCPPAATAPCVPDACQTPGSAMGCRRWAIDGTTSAHTSATEAHIRIMNRSPLWPAPLVVDVRSRRPVAEQVISEELPHPLREVRLVIHERVSLARQDQHVEPLVRLDQRVDQPHRVRRMHVVVDLAVHQHQ